MICALDLLKFQLLAYSLTLEIIRFEQQKRIAILADNRHKLLMCGLWRVHCTEAFLF